MPIEAIKIRGARQHNLKNINVEIPRNRLTVVTGLSGSGKSSLAFDTIYAEGQRRYVESLSAYARQFLDRLEPPDVDSIEGLSPAISIEQKSSARNPRSTVGTVTEIYDYLRLLFSSIGVPHCPECKKPISQQTPDQIVRNLRTLPHGERVMVLAPVVRGRKGEFKAQLASIAKSGYVRARIDGVLHSLDEPIALHRRKNHTIEIVVDRLMIKEGVEPRLESSIEQATKLANGIVQIVVVGGEERLYSEKMACIDCGINLPMIEPRTFSFNSIYGACEKCNGLGVRYDFDPGRIMPDQSQSILNGGLTLNGWYDDEIEKQLVKIGRHFKVDLAGPFQNLPARIRAALFHGVRTRGSRIDGILDILNQEYDESGDEELTAYMATKACAECNGARLQPGSLAVTVAGRTIAEVTSWPINHTRDFFSQLRLNPRESQIAGRIVREIQERLDFLVAVGLDYLSLSRSANTLSGGEGQRIRLANPDWIQTPRGPVCAGRALDRTPPQGQRAPADNPGSAAGPGQHGRRGRT